MSYNLDICIYVYIIRRTKHLLLCKRKGYRVIMDEKSLGKKDTNFIAETLTSEYSDIKCIDNSYTGIVMAHFVSKYSHFVSVTVASLYLQRLFTFCSSIFVSSL